MKAWKSSSDSQIAGYYDLEETIGRGHFAVVKRAKHVFTGEVVATKVVDKTKLDEVARQHLYHEVRCMKLVQHPYVVRLYEVIDTKNKLYLIQEFGDGGDLFDYIVKRDNGLGEDLARKYFRQILSAVAFCHRLHVVHRDLKPENVIFFPKLDVVKVTDFGFSNSFIPGDKLNTACGSLAYSAPEVLLGDAYDAVASDIWSLGVILYMLVVGRLPFSEANDSETLTKIMDCQYKIPNSLSTECQRLLRKLLVKEPSERLSVDKILIDEWFGNEIHNDDVIDMHPLLSRGDLSEEEREHVIAIMVSGNVATREEILKSLVENSYDHLEATFYLLAERHLTAMLAHQMGRFHSRTNSGSAYSSSGRPSSGGDNLLTPPCEPSTPSARKSAETMAAISEAEVVLEEEEEGGDEDESHGESEASRRFSVLIEEPYEDPDQLPQIYEIRENVDDLEIECRKASLTRLANIAEMSESDDGASSGGRPSGRMSLGGGPSDSGPEQEGSGHHEVGSPSTRARSARSSWIGGTSRRSSGAGQLRSGSLSARPTMARNSAPLSVSPFCRLTRSASSSDTSDIESDAMSLSMNRSMARMQNRGGFGKPRNACIRCDMDLPRSLAASLLLSSTNESHHHRRPPRHKRHFVTRQGAVESSEAATTSASDTEQPFSSATSRCQSAAASVTFIVGAVANEQQTQPPSTQQTPLLDGVRRSSLPQTESASIRACCLRALEAKSYFMPPVLQRVPFDQQQLPRSYRHALQMRLRYNHHHGNHRHKRFSATSDAALPPSHLVLNGRHSANPSEAPSHKEKLRARNSVPPRIDEVSVPVPSPESKCECSAIQIDDDYNDSTPLISKSNGNGSIPHAITTKTAEKNNETKTPAPQLMTVPANPLTGHASAPGTMVLSGANAASNRRHPSFGNSTAATTNHPPSHTCELRPLNQLQLVKAQRMSEFSVSTTSRGTGSECSLPASSAASIQNGFKTPSVSSVRSDPDLFHYRNTALPTHCGSTVSAVVGGSCRTSRVQKRSGDEDCEALLGGATSPQNNDSSDVPNKNNATPNTCARCGSLHSSSNNRKRGSSSSHRSGSNHCRAPSSGHAASIRSSQSCQAGGPAPELPSSTSGYNNGVRTITADTSTTVVTSRQNKRNLLRSLFGQCFGCSLPNSAGNSGSNTRATRKLKNQSDQRRNSSSRKKIDSSGLS